MFAAVQACHAEVDYDVWDDIPPRLLVLAWFCCWPHSCNRNCLCCCTPHATNCQYYVNCAVFFLTTPLSYQGTQIIPQVLPYRVWIHRLPQKRWSKVNSETPVYNQTPSIISGCLFNLFCLFSPIGVALSPWCSPSQPVPGGKWRDLFLVASVTAFNTYLASLLPLLGGKPQPLLISNIFDKTLSLGQPWPWDHGHVSLEDVLEDDGHIYGNRCKYM